jgi:hypothetical protein
LIPNLLLHVINPAEVPASYDTSLLGRHATLSILGGEQF